MPFRYVSNAATMSSVAGLTLENDVVVVVDNIRTIQPQTVYPATTRQRSPDNLHFAFGLSMVESGIGCHEFMCDPDCRRFNDLCEAYLKNRFPRKIIFPAQIIIEGWRTLKEDDVPLFPFNKPV